LSVSAIGAAAPELMAQIETEIRLVEEELRQQVGSQVKLVREVGRHTLDAGGKRLRPALVSLCAEALGRPFDKDRARKLGASMEMVHMATLIHDDVIDNAPTRRGRPTASTIFGNTASILSGDVLLSKAMAILAVDGDIEIIRCVSNAVVEMAEGEVLELQTRGTFDLAEQDHFEILRMKTSVFIKACCEVGAMVAGSSPEEREALATYGHHIGMAFQVVDDLLDYRGDQVKVGKRQATDFREGCATLPLIYLRESLTESEQELTRDRFGNGVTDDEIRMICDWMDSRGAFKRAADTAEGHVQDAIAALAPLPSSPQKELLGAVAQFVSLRQA
jgi:octaprenyl-diphosphate synthase